MIRGACERGPGRRQMRYRARFAARRGHSRPEACESMSLCTRGERESGAEEP